MRKQVIWESKEKNKESQKGNSKPISEPPNLEGKLEYLYYVGAKDCIDMEQQWKQGFQQIKPRPNTRPRKARNKRSARLKKLGNTLAVVEVGKPTKIEIKALKEEQIRLVKAYSLSDDSEEEVTED